MKTCNTAHEALARAAVARVLGADVTLRAIPTYPDSIVYECTTARRVAIFKAIDPDGRDPDRISVEAWALDAARAAGVVAPEVLAADTSRAWFPSSFLVMEKVVGRPVDEVCAGVDAGVAHEIGEQLRRMHSVTVAGWGPLHERDPGVVRGGFESWSAAVRVDVVGSLAHLEEHVLTPGDTRRLDDALAAIEVRDPDRACLLHNDLGESHVFVDPVGRRLTGIVDFGECAAGDPIWDLLELDWRWATAVAAGYGVDDSIEAQLRRHRLLKSVPWAAKWHRRGEVQVIDWLLTVLEACESA